MPRTPISGGPESQTNDAAWGRQRPAGESVDEQRARADARWGPVVARMRPSRRQLARRASTLGAVTVVLLAALAAGLVVNPAAAQSSSVTVTNVTLETETPTVGETFVVEARIANAESAEGSFDLRQVYVEGPGGRGQIANDLGTLAPGTTTTVRLPVTVEEPGWHTLTLDVRGWNRADTVVTLDHPIPVQVQGDRDERLSMAATAEDLGPSNRTDVTVTLANGFDEPITSVELQAASDTLSLPEPQRIASRMPAGNETAFTLPARDVTTGQHTIDVAVRYTTPGGDRHVVRRNLTTAVTAVSQPGRIELTELAVVRQAGSLAVSGSASNVGTTDVSGVTVSVEESETAGPGAGAATFFVGDVPASDFSSFDVAVSPRTNGTITIPLEVSYVVDGVRISRTVEVSHRVQPQPDPASQQSGGGGGLLLPAIGLLVVIGAIVYWRRYRG